MVSVRTCQIFLLSAALAVTPAFAGRSHRTATAGHTHGKGKKHTHVIQGQRGIDSDRAREIQTALISKNYMSGEPSGQWDSETQAAMQKFQSDHGWQTKLTPDSRALISLGLGPNHEAAPIQTADRSTVSAPAPTAAAAALPAPRVGNTLADAHSIQN